MKYLNKCVQLILIINTLNFAQAQIVIPAGFVVNMETNYKFVGVLEVVEEVSGSLNGTVEPTILTDVLEYGGLTFSQPFSGTITMNTQSAFSSSNPKSTLRSYELNNSGSQLTTNLNVAFNPVTESNNIADRFIYTQQSGNWKGYSDNGSTPTKIKAATVTIPTGTSNIVISEGIGVGAKIFLEGPFQGGATPMTNSLNLPEESPYLEGKRSVNSGAIPNNAVDWISVELRNGSTSLGYRSAFVDVDGNIINDNGDIGIGFPALPSSITSANYHIVIRHRNHLPIMSSVALAFDWYSN